MKLMFVVSSYGSRPRVTLDYRQTLFFRGEEPSPETVITVDLPGLKHTDPKSVLGWLSKRAKKQGVTATRGRLGGEAAELGEIDRELWRPAKLEDVLTAQNWMTICWQLARHFPSADFRRFLERQQGEAQRALDEALALEGEARARALARIHPREQRIFSVLYQRPGAIDHERLEILRKVEDARVTKLRDAGFDAKIWAAAARKLHHPVVRTTFLRHFAREAAKLGGAKPAMAALDQLRRVKVLKDAVAHDTTFWKPLTRVIELDSNARNLELSLANADEITVPLNWETLAASRVGKIVPGRTALRVLHEGRPVYLRGERKLAFVVQRAGGRLDKHGNTLLMPPGMGDALLTVERIDTLANLDPAQAAALAEPLGLPKDHEVYRRAAAAVDDPRQRRILADLLVELLVGVDADVARRLARDKARANRR